MSHYDRPINSYPSIHEDAVHDIQVNSLGTRLATCSSDGFVVIHSVSEHSLTHIATLSGHAHPVYRLSWSTSGLLASAGASGFLIIFQEQPDSANVYEPLFKFDHQSPVNDVAFFMSSNPEEPSLLATCTADGYLHIFEQSGDDFTHRKYPTQSSSCTSVSFHDTLKIIATGDEEGVVKIWEFRDESFKVAFELNSHSSPITDLSFAPSHGIPSVQILASSSSDGQVNIWSGSDKNYHQSSLPTEFSSPVSRVSWSESGVALFVSSDVVSVWSRFDGEWSQIGTLDNQTTELPKTLGHGSGVGGRQQLMI
ncbi:hypothetical protein P9112_011212 [Eukaryota sp. TZLM1-RC]